MKTPKRNENKAITPAVIALTAPVLPEDTVETPPGPEADIAVTAANENDDKPIVSYDTTSEDLLASATGRYEDIPAQTDEEIAAVAIAKAAEEETESVHPAAIEPSHPEQKFVDVTFTAVTQFGDALNQLGTSLKTTATYVGLRVIRAKHDSWDFIKMLGNKAYAFYDKRKKVFEEKRIAAKAKAYAEIAEYMAEMVAEKFSALEHAVQVELRRNANSIKALNEVLHSDFKKTNNVSNGLISKVAKVTTPTIDAKELDALLAAVKQNRNVKAVGIYRKLTGVDLATATAAVAA